MNYLNTYKLFLNFVAIISSVLLSVFSTSHYIFLNEHKFIYRFHKQWYTFSSSCTVVILITSAMIWFLSSILPLIVNISMDFFTRAETYVDSLTISICILWVTHLLIELSMDYPVEYREILSQSLVLYVLVLAVRLPLFVTIDYAINVKTYIKESRKTDGFSRSNRNNIVVPWTF